MDVGGFGGEYDRGESERNAGFVGGEGFGPCRCPPYTPGDLGGPLISLKFVVCEDWGDNAISSGEADDSAYELGEPGGDELAMLDIPPITDGEK